MEQRKKVGVSGTSVKNRAISASLIIVGFLIGIVISGYGAIALLQVWHNPCPGGNCSAYNPVTGVLIILLGFGIIGGSYKKAKELRNPQ